MSDQPAADSAHFLYFAYGSNMCSPRLRARTPSARALGAASLAGYRLNFHKMGRDGSGKCSIAAGQPHDCVWGVVFRIAAADRGALDQAEGLGQHYNAREVAVTLASPPTPSTAPALTAWTYVACAVDAGAQPFDWYHAYVLAGAREHALPDWYVQAAIAQVPTVADTDWARAQANRLPPADNP